ncbi:MAG: CDP-diacylglycerol--glycerol-3-phosphate 3-phosphatidyltransferase [Desulfobacterales bacterium]|nr:CDP-diacylglycerol--glycerol-3-phosphate 3-phosphatidyltransferase [Desulfobacterales bacterium]MDD4071838.1 CDP-diacylglycerol--glycerol-3-phosphate 3-phosphatidyltransferase [Desulfobacterales bacterium]MDD4392545.1 CDP-diacylglycerol--glycerol-3-phosphate 3-phosphatidyltransferase [Desulfobacterales bacterium]
MLNGNDIRKKLYHPNSLTLYRVAAIPGIVALMLYPNRTCTFLAAILFSLAAITDYLDGYVARRHGLVSTFGKIMDPLADKLLVSSAFIMMSSYGWIPAWIVCIIIGRELAVNGLRIIVVENKADVSASRLGKYKTGFQIAAIIPLLIHYSYFEIDFHGIGLVFLWVALGLTVLSGADYFIRFRKLLFS